MIDTGNGAMQIDHTRFNNIEHCYINPARHSRNHNRLSPHSGLLSIHPTLFPSATHYHLSCWKPFRISPQLCFPMDRSSSPPDRRHDVPNRPKRRKIAVACDECRSRKVRCDGVQPGMCALFNVICFIGVYPVDGYLVCSVWSMYEEGRSSGTVHLYWRAGEKASRPEVSLFAWSGSACVASSI